MNLPTSLTVARIATTPLIAGLPLIPTATARLWALILFLVAVNTDWIDGYLARSRKEETDLGRRLDPLADKLLLLGTFIPMFWLARTFPFQTPLGTFGLPWWVVAIVLGREVTMTWFREYALRRGVVISSNWPAKWKTFITGFWQGSAYCWFWISTLAVERSWGPSDFHRTTVAVGSLGATCMIVGVGLTLYSAVLYLRQYGRIIGTKAA